MEEPKKYKNMTTKHIADLAAANFQKYIRLRDAHKGGHCISCGKWIEWNNDCDAGHYISRRHNKTKFDENNCHAQCKHCNRWLNGNIIEYRKRLIQKIGIDILEDLENNYNELTQRKRIDYIDLNELYLKKCRDIKK